MHWCFYLMIRHPPRSTLLPYTTLSRSSQNARWSGWSPDKPGPVASPAAVRTLPPSSRAVSSAQELTERSEEHTSELQSRQYLVCRLLLENKNNVRTK